MKKNFQSEVFIWLIGFLVFSVGCNQTSNNQASTLNTTSNDSPSTPLFSVLPKTTTGIGFNNVITESGAHNFYTDQYMYNGGGVAIGDINNDELPDLFFAGNQVSNKLYLNKGDLKFEDVSAKAQVEVGGWCTGATMVDLNQDGYLDIYVTRRNNNDNNIQDRTNLLFINNKDNTFTEQAKKYGIADAGFGVHSAFFDYDNDGDLDLYVTNYANKFNLSNKEMKAFSKNPSDFERDKLYKNNGDLTFTEISKKVGINNLGHGLGLGIGDLDGNGLPDIYVGNDYQTSDFCYMNLGNERFVDGMSLAFRHTSQFSMGLDIADFNNDGLLDICVADMNPEDNYRQKTNMPSMNPQKFYNAIASGYHPQYMRNALQLNNGNAIFSEIGQLANIPNTDWSWAVLFADYDNDGLKDILITNGYLRDVDNKDYKKKVEKYKKASQVTWKELKEDLESTKLPNYFFKNNGDLTFSKVSSEWGIQGEKVFSNGAAYGDLDLDGDLDIVINNINDPASILQNNAQELSNNNYLQITLKGSVKNPSGIGTKVKIKTNGEIQYQEFYPSRGYASSMDPILHFGIGNNSSVDEIEVIWFNGQKQTLFNVKANQKIEVKLSSASQAVNASETINKKTFKSFSDKAGINFVHKENIFDDYKDQVLLPHEMSKFGPRLAVGDINNDGLEDVFVGGAANQAGVLFLQVENMKFRAVLNQPWTKDSAHEDLDALFFDANGDGWKDLYVVSGGNEFPEGSPLLQDRLYMNIQGKGFSQNSGLPQMLTSGGSVSAGDVDGDGDLDLFIGGRLTPGKYLKAPRSYFLINTGKGFVDATKQFAPALQNIGMVTSATWVDYDKNGTLDLIVVGEWMPITVFKNTGTSFENHTEASGLSQTTGWWNKIEAADFDKDGDMDFVVGNLGLNYKYKATKDEPFNIYCKDFDQNGKWDIVLGYIQEGTEYPLRGRQCSSEQLPFIEEKFPTYASFASSDIEDVYGDQLSDAVQAKAYEFRSVYIENNGGNLVLKPLPNRAQISPIQGIVCDDFNKDGHLDILTAGNLYVAEVETGAADAGVGLLLQGDGTGNFQSIPPNECGIFANLDVRDVEIVSGNGNENLVIITNNNNRTQVFQYDKAAVQ